MHYCVCVLDLCASMMRCFAEYCVQTDCKMMSVAVSMYKLQLFVLVNMVLFTAKKRTGSVLCIYFFLHQISVTVCPVFLIIHVQ